MNSENKVDEVVLEIRSAEGGDDAKLFAETLENMYIKFCKHMGFLYEVVERMRCQFGSSKIRLRIIGNGAYA